MRHDLHIPRYVAFFGVKGSGKSTMGSVLQRYLPQMSILGFADPLKSMVKDIFDFSDEDLYGSTDKRETLYKDFELSGDCLSCGAACDVRTEATDHNYWQCPRCGNEFPRYVNPRVALQSLGTEWGRRLYRSIWAVAGITRARKQDAAALIDGRFWNELRLSQTRGLLTIGLLRGTDRKPGKHPSEAEPYEIVTQRACHITLDNQKCSVEEAEELLLYALSSHYKHYGDTHPFVVVGDP